MSLLQEQTYGGNKGRSFTTVEIYFTMSDQRHVDRTLKHFVISFLFSEGDHRDDPPVRGSLFQKVNI